MKILYTAYSKIPSKEANSVQVMRMCEAFSKQNELLLITPSFRIHSSENLFDLYGVKKSFDIRKTWTPRIKFKTILHVIQLFYWYNNFKPELIYGRDLIGCALLSVFKETFFELHKPLESKLEISLFNFLIHSKKFKGLVVISDALKNMVLAEFPNLRSKILVEHDCVRSESINFSNSIKSDIKKDLSLNIGYAGSLYKGRGIEFILKLARLNPNDKFNIAGGSAEEIETLKFNCPENCFFHGHLPPSKVSDFLQEQDILLAPYSSNLKIARGGMNTSAFMSPLKIFEYLAAGRPMIVSDLVVLHEILNKDMCIMAKENHLEIWSLAIEELRCRETRRFYAQNSINHVQNFTWISRVDRILSKL